MSSTKRLVLYSCKGKTSKYKDNERSVDLTSQLARYYINEVEEGSSRMLVKCYIHNKKKNTLRTTQLYTKNVYICTYDYRICCGLKYTYFYQNYDNVNEYAW